MLSVRGRPSENIMSGVRSKFLSTPSARRATITYTDSQDTQAISIHALREEGDHSFFPHTSTTLISIHALREEGDSSSSMMGSKSKYFYPRPP